jgi:hypothetical protein
MKEHYPDFVTTKCWLSMTVGKGSVSCMMPKNQKEAIAMVQAEIDDAREEK